MLNAYCVYGFVSCLLDVDDLFAKQTSKDLEHVYTAFSVTKCLELLDTIFRIVSHKTRYISDLHVFTHCIMLIVSDYARMNSPWPLIAPIFTLNAAVNSLTYYYYFSVARNPADPPRWMKYVKKAQVYQYLIDLIYCAYGYMQAGFCAYSMVYSSVLLVMYMWF